MPSHRAGQAGSLNYAHPPWCLIARVLRKVRLEKTALVLITPLWRSQPWFPMILDMLVDYPLLMPVGVGVIQPSPNCNCPLGLHNQLQLVAWKVSGDSLEHDRFLKEQLSSSWVHGEARPIPITIRLGSSGKGGATQEISVPFLQISRIY